MQLLHPISALQNISTGIDLERSHTKLLQNTLTKGNLKSPLKEFQSKVEYNESLVNETHIRGQDVAHFDVILLLESPCLIFI